MNQFRVWREYFENILVAVFVALLVRSFILTGYKVPTGSMSPALLPGDFIFAYKLPYGVKFPLLQKKLGSALPKRGEIVVFTYPDQPRTSYVKRVIGLPGDYIQIIDGALAVNGKSYIYEEILDNSADAITAKSELVNPDLVQILREVTPIGKRSILALKEGKKKNFGPVVVPPNEIFLMGDNRDASDDSRYWGTVPTDRIEGRVVLIWLSINWLDHSLRWERIMTSPQ